MYCTFFVAAIGLHIDVVVVVVVVVVVIVFVVVVVPNVDVVKAMSKVDLRLLVKEVEFGWWGGGWCAKSFSCQTQLS